MAHSGILSKGIKLGYRASGTTGTYTNIPDLQEIPDLGGEPEQVDVTTLADSNYHYIAGIKDFDALTFLFLYDNDEATSNYRVLRSLEEAGDELDWEIEFPDGTKFDFSGTVSTAIVGAGVNAALQFNATITLNSDLEVVNPAAAAVEEQEGE